MNTMQPGGLTPEHKLATPDLPVADEIRDPIFGIPDVPMVSQEEIQAELEARIRAFNERMPVFGDTYSLYIDAANRDYSPQAVPPVDPNHVS